MLLKFVIRTIPETGLYCSFLKWFFFKLLASHLLWICSGTAVHKHIQFQKADFAYFFFNTCFPPWHSLKITSIASSALQEDYC